MAKLFIIMTVIISGLFGYPQWQGNRAKEEMLAATVQITMIVPQWTEAEQQPVESLPVPPDEYRPIARVEGYIIAEGLGTVVQENGRSYLITHDHWSLLAANLGDVQFRDATGTLLAEMSLYDFKGLILSRNGGIMVLATPDALQKSARIVTSTRLTGDDDLWLVHRYEGRVIASQVHKVATDVKNGVGVWRLQGQMVVNGDSGGGVWVNGRLVATIWMAVMMESQTNAERRATDLSIAAILKGMP